MAINTKYSYKDLSGRDFTNYPASDFDGDVVGSYFYTQNLEPIPVWIKRFPVGITTNFIDCNLDNIEVPETATVENCCNRQYVYDDAGDILWL